MYVSFQSKPGRQEIVFKQGYLNSHPHTSPPAHDLCRPATINRDGCKTGATRSEHGMREINNYTFTKINIITHTHHTTHDTHTHTRTHTHINTNTHTHTHTHKHENTQQPKLVESLHLYGLRLTRAVLADGLVSRCTHCVTALVCPAHLHNTRTNVGSCTGQNTAIRVPIVLSWCSRDVSMF
jgi:hypothetical protein